MEFSYQNEKGYTGKQKDVAQVQADLCLTKQYCPANKNMVAKPTARSLILFHMA